MDVRQTDMSGLLVIEPRCFRDDRGFFLESFRAMAPRKPFVQGNHSRSRRGALRGLHFGVKRPQAQIVTVVRGRIFDVAVDLRPGSGSFGQELSDEGPRQLSMGPGFALCS
jgi:dTDP-4-dehydrorhamnose 3,5-epimerase